LSSPLCRAGRWFLHSGIQESGGGVARYYRCDIERNNPVSTEITGYAASTLVYLHSVTHDEAYLARAVAAARFLTRTAWDAESRGMPFEMDGTGTSPAYFFDCGIVVRGLLSVWRATGDEEFLDVATALGQAMAADFLSAEDVHPILSLRGKRPWERDSSRWSRSPGCYQLKAAMAWWDLAETTGQTKLQEAYNRVLAWSLRTWGGFLPGHADRARVMDRLHAFLYFLEGLLPRASDPQCAATICAGIRAAAEHLREIAPEFERSDVYAQLLRMRLYADWSGVAPLDRPAAQQEAECLAGFQLASPDRRRDGGFWFGRNGDRWLPFVNPVSAAFALQALELWDACRRGEALPHRHLLI
jgi:hypothetical protein